MACFRLSASLNELDELARRVSVSPQFSSTNESRSLPSVAFNPSVAALRAQLAQAERQRYILETENVFLRNDVEDLQTTVRFLLIEISILRTELQLERDDKNASRSRRVHKITQLEKRLDAYHTFIRALTEVELHDPIILGRGLALLIKDYSAEDALVEAIRIAARERDSPWSKIVPAVAGNRVSENYLAVIDLFLKTRKELHDMENAARFWKSQFAFPFSLPHVPTSASCRAPGEDTNYQHRGRLGSPTGVSGNFHGGSAMAKTDKDQIRTPLLSHSTSPPPLLGPVSLENIVYKNEQNLITHRRNHDSNTLRRSNSDSSRSTTVMSRRNRAHATHPRRITFHDLNNLEVQATDKRHGFIMPCVKSIFPERDSVPTIMHLSPGNCSDVRVSDTDGRKCNDQSSSTLLSSIPGPSLLDLGTTPDISAKDCRTSLGAAEALQSVERLCASFSSGSLGSLEMSILSNSSCDTAAESTHAYETINWKGSGDLQEKMHVKASDSVTPSLEARFKPPSNTTKSTEIKSLDTYLKAFKHHKPCQSCSLSCVSPNEDILEDTVSLAVTQYHEELRTNASDRGVIRNLRNMGFSASQGHLINHSPGLFYSPAEDRTSGKTVRICHNAMPQRVAEPKDMTSKPRRILTNEHIRSVPAAPIQTSQHLDTPRSMIGPPASCQAPKSVTVPRTFVKPVFIPRPSLGFSNALGSAPAKKAATSATVTNVKKNNSPVTPVRRESKTGCPPSAPFGIPLRVTDSINISAVLSRDASNICSKTSNVSAANFGDDLFTSRQKNIPLVADRSPEPHTRKAARVPLVPAQKKRINTPRTPSNTVNLGLAGGSSVSDSKAACFTKGNSVGSSSGTKGAVGRPAQAQRACIQDRENKLESRRGDKKP